MPDTDNPEKVPEHAGPTTPSDEDSFVDLGSSLGDELDAAIPAALTGPEPVPEPVIAKPAPTHIHINPHGVSISKLPNGMTVLHLRIRKPALLAVLRVGAGHIHDPSRLEGSAHLVMYQLFAGSDGREYTSREEFQRWAKEQRLRFDEPTVDNYFTEFSGKCLAEQMPTYLETMYKLLFKPTFGLTIDQAREAIQEKRVELGITDKSEGVRQAILQMLCRRHRIAAATGFPDDLTLYSNSLENLTEFQGNRYTLSNTVLAAATNVEHLEFLDLVQSKFVQVGEHREDTYKPVVLKAEPLVLNSGYSEAPQGKKVSRMEFTFTWMISRDKVAVSTLVRDIVEKLFSSSPLKDISKVEIARSPELDTFTIRLKTMAIDTQKAQQIRGFINKTFAAATQPEKDALARCLKDIKGSLEEKLSFDDEPATDTLEQAMNDWCLYGKVFTPEERLKAIQEVTIHDVLTFLSTELTPPHCFTTTVEHAD